jgi:hypothetical protein
MINPTPPVNTRYGAPLGRRGNGRPDDCAKLYLRHVPLDAGGYDRGGAYWGHGARLYWAASDDGFEAYLRASTRDAAKAKLLAEYPDVCLTFYR